MVAPVINRMVDLPEPGLLTVSAAGKRFAADHLLDDRHGEVVLERAEALLDEACDAVERSGDQGLGTYLDILTVRVEDAQARPVDLHDLICLPPEAAADVAAVVFEMDATSALLDRATDIIDCLNFTSARLGDVAEFVSRFDTEQGLDVRVGAVDDFEWERFGYQVHPAVWVPWSHLEQFVVDVRARVMPVADALRDVIPHNVLDTGLATPSA